MKIKRFLLCNTIGIVLFATSAFVQVNKQNAKSPIRFPYKKMGLTDKQAAAHLLSRFSFGATPGQVDEVAQMGLEQWFQQQLDAKLPDEEVNKRLTNYDALAMNNETIVNTYLNGGQIIKMLQKSGQIVKDSNFNKPEYRDEVKKYMQENGLKPQQELQRQLVNQKIIRAAYGNNQLQEILTDFWFNHFNVSLTKNQSAPYILTYERDAIRPNVFGKFETILEATAKHPAMLEYLDNASSVSNNNNLARRQQNSVAGRIQEQKMEETMNNPNTNAIVKQALQGRKSQGLNENYAREIMELHTLGVDGGYTQTDVTEVARALTGWAIVPLVKDTPGRKLFDASKQQNLEKQGFIIEGDFLFRANKHDEGEKTILGEKFPANRGYSEGIRVLEMLSNHPATAKFICKKLATRFVCDTPSVAFINQLADVYLKTKGSIKEVLIAMVNNTEFWSNNALREKVKSPFELAISSIRSTHADVQQPFQVFNWCTKMGQKLYSYQAPTGFPDRASYWINTGSLLNRMNFGLAFATQKIPGITVDLAALNNHHEPESAEAALSVYSNLLLPERNNTENNKRLLNLVNDNTLQQKITQAADKTVTPIATTNDEMIMDNVSAKKEAKLEKAELGKPKGKPTETLYVQGNTNTVSQVVGIIIGSPEFQRK
jgi:uncharacterized protein (DUF1800 family)